MKKTLEQTNITGKRICHLLWSYNVGGTESMLIDIANEQSKTNDIHVVIVNNSFDRELVAKFDKRVKVHFVGRPPKSRNPWWVIKMNRDIARIHPDIIHCHMPGIKKYYYLSIPAIFTAHSCMQSADDLKRYKTVCCISNAVKQCVNSLGCNNTVVITNGIRTNLITPRDSNAPAGGRLRIVCVGRLAEIKGQHVLVEACRLLKERHGKDNFTLDIIGEGETRDAIEEMIDRYGLRENVNMPGLRNRQYIYSHLKDYDLYVMPSINEGFGLTLAEACAAKVPVLSCDLPGPLEVIGNGKYGMTFKTGDADDLALQLARFIDNRPSPALIEEACRNVRENFDVTATAHRYLEVYGRELSGE